MNLSFYQKLIIGVVLFLGFSVSNANAITWLELRPWGDRNTATVVSAMNSDGSFILACEYFKRCATSSDSGATWSETFPAGTGQDLQWEGVRVLNEGQLLFVFKGGASGTVWYRSTDSGATWSVLPNHNMNFNASYDSPLCVSTDGATMWISSSISSYTDVKKTTNSGASWVINDPVGSNSTHTYYIRGCSADLSTVYVSAKLKASPYTETFYRTKNGGTSWTLLNPSVLPNVTLEGVNGFATDSDGSFLIYANWSGRVYYSTNYGDTFSESMPKGDFTGNWWGLRADQTGNKVFLCEQGGRCWFSNTGAVSWSETQPKDNNNYSWRYISMSKNTNMFLAHYDSGRMFKGISTGNEANTNITPLAPNGAFDTNDVVFSGTFTNNLTVGTYDKIRVYLRRFNPTTEAITYDYKYITLPGNGTGTSVPYSATLYLVNGQYTFTSRFYNSTTGYYSNDFASTVSFSINTNADIIPPGAPVVIPYTPQGGEKYSPGFVDFTGGISNLADFKISAPDYTKLRLRVVSADNVIYLKDMDLPNNSAPSYSFSVDLPVNSYTYGIYAYDSVNNILNSDLSIANIAFSVVLSGAYVGESAGFCAKFSWPIVDVCNFIVPPDNYFTIKINELVSSANSAFPFFGQLKDAFAPGIATLTSADSTMPTYPTVSFMGLTLHFIDLTKIADFIAYWKLMLSGILWFMFFSWFLRFAPTLFQV